MSPGALDSYHLGGEALRLCLWPLPLSPGLVHWQEESSMGHSLSAAPQAGQPGHRFFCKHSCWLSPPLDPCEFPSHFPSGGTAQGGKWVQRPVRLWGWRGDLDERTCALTSPAQPPPLHCPLQVEKSGTPPVNLVLTIVAVVDRPRPKELQLQAQGPFLTPALTG